MKILYCIVFAFFTLPKSYSQSVTIINDTLNVAYEKNYADPEIDSIVYIKNENRFTQPWIVFYYKDKNQVAYSSSVSGDTTIMLNFWRNGNKKSKSIYIKDKDGYSIWFYEEIYCANGQLVRSSFPNKVKRQHIINYYCNGMVKNEFEKVGIGVDGGLKSWYENGNKKNEFIFKNNKAEGEWKYFNEDGTISKIEKYKNGRLVTK